MKPSSLEEAIEEIQRIFSEKQLRDWSKKEEEIACLDAHWDLGLWIRNQWVYGSGSPLSAIIKEQAVIIDEDSISSFILRALWRVLNSEDCPTIQELISLRV